MTRELDDAIYERLREKGWPDGDTGPTEVENLKEACAHLTSSDIVQRLNASTEVIRFLLAQPHSFVMEYEYGDGSGRRAASVRAVVHGVSVSGISEAGEAGYPVLLEAWKRNRKAIDRAGAP